MTSLRSRRPKGRTARAITVTASVTLGLVVALLLGACSSDDDDNDPQGPGAADASSQGTPDATLGTGLSAQCNALCDRTPVASDQQGDCTALTLTSIGSYDFPGEPSCVALADAFDLGVATAAQCVSCYLDANVAAGDCTQAEAICF